MVATTSEMKIPDLNLGESIQKILSEAEDEKEYWERQILEAKGRIEALEFIILAQRRALNAYRKGVLPTSEGKWDHITKKDLEEMSVRQILIHLAHENEGILKGLDAVRVLMRTGIVADRRSADAQVYTVLNREKDTFWKMEPGVYQLVDNSNVDDLPF